MNFDQWMSFVDSIIENSTGGFTSTDFPEQLWREWFDAELEPVEAVARLLDNESFND